MISLSNNRLPSDWQLTTSIATDQNNRSIVTGFTCSVTEANAAPFHNWPAQTLEGLNSNHEGRQPTLPFSISRPFSPSGRTAATPIFRRGHGMYLPLLRDQQPHR